MTDSADDFAPIHSRSHIPRSLPRWLTGPRLPLALFCAYLVAAFFLVLFKLSKYMWFNLDEWYFLAGRDATTIDGLFAPHNEHWTTLPILAFRAMYGVVGLHSYRPYQAMVVLTHLGICLLVWVIMRRVGVRPWIATCSAAVLVLFGPGQQNIVWAFQITFSGSILFGLAHMITTDHDGPVDRRDWIGLFFGAAALMTSGAAPVLVVAVGVAALLRRGWKPALFHTAPLAALFGVWYLIEQPHSAVAFGYPSISVLADWIMTGEAGIFGAIGHFAIVGALLAAMLVVGLLVAWLPLDFASFRVRAAMPLALLLAVPMFFTLTSTGRWIMGIEYARSGRYMHLGTALTLPALAVAADAIARRWRILTPAVVALLMLGIPWNANQFDDAPLLEKLMRRQEQLVIGAAYSPMAAEVPDWVELDRSISTGGHLTMGWLRSAKQAGKIPGPIPLDRATERQLELQVGLVPIEKPGSTNLKCRAEKKIAVRPKKGDRFRISSAMDVSTTSDGERPESVWVRYTPEAKYLDETSEDGGMVLETQFDGLYLLLAATGPGTFTYCTK
jgi:hypothetical protein